MAVHETIVYDSLEPCPYLDDQVSRLPLRYQRRRPSASEFDDSLGQGDRRVGMMLYRTNCPTCRACEPIRVPVMTFKPSKSQRRLLNKNKGLQVKLGPAIFTQERLELFNRHKFERGLNKNERPMKRSGYENWLLHSCANTREFRYYFEEKLIGVSILDFGERDVSSVYFYFDPDFAHLSLGTYSALFEIMWMRSRALRHYYLGLYVADCSHLSYKARFYPHQRLINGEWVELSSRKSLSNGAEP